jgi:hypothetical protein
MIKKTFQSLLLSLVFSCNLFSMDDEIMEEKLDISTSSIIGYNGNIEFLGIPNLDIQENIFGHFFKLSDFVGIFLTLTKITTALQKPT